MTTDTDTAREVARLRSRRGNNASADAQADLGAIILAGNDVTLVCRALLDATRLLRAQREAQAATQLVGSSPGPLEVELTEAHRAVAAAARRMDRDE